MEATIHNIPSEEGIGVIHVPDSFFTGNKDRSGEFILLSSNIEQESDETCRRPLTELGCCNIMHVGRCKHIRTHNIMLIEWEGNVARRRGLGTVRKDDWAKVETHKKRITLG